MNLSELIDTHRGARTYAELARDCGGSPSAERIRQLLAQPMKNFPDPPSVRGLAKGLRVAQSVIVLSAAETLGLDVRTGVPRLVELLPADTRDLTEQQAAAIAHLVRTIVDEQVARDSEDPAPTFEPIEPKVLDVLAAQAAHRAKTEREHTSVQKVAARKTPRKD